MKLYKYNDYNRHVYIQYNEEIPFFIKKYFQSLALDKKTNVICLFLDGRTYSFCDQFEKQRHCFKENNNFIYDIIEKILEIKKGNRRKER